jgi:hypothetical protein
MRTTVRPAAAAAPSQPEATPAIDRSRDFDARMVTLEPGCYAFALTGDRRRREPIAGLPLPAVHVCEAEHSGGLLEIVDDTGGAGSWLGGGRTILFVKSAAGGAALVTAHLARGPDTPPLELEIRRVDAAGDEGIRLRLGGADAASGSPPPVRLDVVAHIRGRGDVGFAGPAPVGRLGPGMWIEAFTIASPDVAAAAAIEYKGLSASGSETPWLGCGASCGTTGTGVPLLGFAIRQKGAAAARFDCEYTGYFQSGAAVGPLRNGAPCRSPRDNDPLEGMALRVTPRPARTAPAAG